MKLKLFLDFDSNLEKDYIKEEIYTLQYPNGNKCDVSYGYIADINEFDIIHKCSTNSTNRGSSGGPII